MREAVFIPPPFFLGGVICIMSAITQKTRKPRSNEKRLAKYGWIFAAPWLFGLLVFYFYPLLSSIFYSLTDFNGMRMNAFVGLENYRMLFRDNVFWISIRNTLLYAALVVPVGIIFGVSVALLLNFSSKFQGIYRVIAFLPTLVPVVASAIIWQWLLNSQFGIVNYYLYEIGIDNPPPWFGSATWAKPAMMLITQWGIGTTILTYLAGLQDIPQQYYEAATIDGAGAIRRFTSVTLPLLTPVIFFNLVMSIIASCQMFVLPMMISPDGTPANTMMFYAMFLYRNAFSYLKMGYANAMAWMMFVVVLGLTVIIYGTSNRWVHYLGE